MQTALNFNAIDTNGDLKIDLKEALDSFGMDENLETPPTWFSDMDANKDGFIGTEEFDPDLNDDIVIHQLGTHNDALSCFNIQ